MSSTLATAVRALHVGPAPVAGLPATAAEDFDVVGEADPETALERLDAGGFDCVISEHELEGTDGLTFLREVKRRHSDLPVILVSRGRGGPRTSRTITAGIDRHVRHPPDRPAEELAAKLRSIALAATDRSRVPDPGNGPRPERTAPDRTTLVERAMAEAPVGVTISDLSRPDEPLVYVNDAFERLTGYSREEALGRNCRFLQGDASNPEAIATMRAAIDAGEPTSVELRNYRKDGTEFWNKVDIAPIRGPDGEVTHYVGFQTDITDRRTAETKASERAAELREERRNSERLLERINGLFKDVTNELVRGVNRSEIEQAVCDRLAADEAYSFAWIGGVDIATEGISERARAAGEGVEPLAFDPDGFRIDADGGHDHPAAAAAATRTPQVGRDVVGGGDAGADARFDVAAIPLVYQETLYGILNVYTRRAEAFHEREMTVLRALGRAVATAVHASESRRILSTDSAIELEFQLDDPTPFFTALTARTDAKLELSGSINRADGSALLFFTVEGDPGPVETAIDDLDGIADAALIVEREDVSVFEFEVTEDPIVTELAELGATTQSIEAADGSARITVETPDEQSARTVADLIEGRYDGAELLTYQERERPPTTKQEFIAALEERLTERQLTALRKAFASGFFEWKRPVSGDELAESMDISRSTFHQHLRAAERKLVEEFLDR